MKINMTGEIKLIGPKLGHEEDREHVFGSLTCVFGDHLYFVSLCLGWE